MELQTPLAPPVFAVVHAWHVPVQALLQHTPSAQKPVWQSAPVWHFLPCAHLFAHVVPPPQSTSVSAPSSAPSSQSWVMKQPSGTAAPQVLPSWAQVFGAQPQTPPTQT